MAETEAGLATEFSADREGGNDESVQEHAPSARHSAYAEDAPAERPARDEEHEEEINTQEEPAKPPAAVEAEGGEDDDDEEELDGGELPYVSADEEPETQERHEETVEEPMEPPRPSIEDMATAFLGEVTKSRGEVDERSILVFLDEWLASDAEAAQRARLEFADAIVLKAAVNLSMIAQVDMIARKVQRTFDGVRGRQDTIVSAASI
jgi:hypothetical protein